MRNFVGAWQSAKGGWLEKYFRLLFRYEKTYRG
jgi:hypothetical protein